MSALLAFNEPPLNRKVMGSDPLGPEVSMSLRVMKEWFHKYTWGGRHVENLSSSIRKLIKKEPNTHQCSKTWASASLMRSFYLRFMFDVNNEEVVIKKIHLQV